MNRVVLTSLAAFLSVIPSAAICDTTQLPPPPIVGDWTGPLQGTPLHLVFHIVQKSTGLTVTADCPEQNLYSEPCGSISQADSSVTIPIPRIPGSFTGQVSTDGKTITGTWSQDGHDVPLLLTWHAPTVTEPLPKVVKGACFGKLLVATTVLHLVVHFIRDSDGTVFTTMDSPDQGVDGIEGGVVSDVDGTISIPVPPVAGIFRGKLASDQKSLVGIWNQGTTTSLPLTLTLDGNTPAVGK